MKELPTGLALLATVGQHRSDVGTPPPAHQGSATLGNPSINNPLEWLSIDSFMTRLGKNSVIIKKRVFWHWERFPICSKYPVNGYAIRSALTGHLVFSTLHTNDAPGAVTRLVDMGVEAYLLASSLEGVLAQRLVRTICPHCKAPHHPQPEILQRIGQRPNNGETGTFFRGKGCRNCRQTGYLGRTGIFELLRVSPKVRDSIVRCATANEIAAAAPQDHHPMREDGFRKAAEGITTVEEVLRVTQDTQTEEALS